MKLMHWLFDPFILCKITYSVFEFTVLTIEKKHNLFSRSIVEAKLKKKSVWFAVWLLRRISQKKPTVNLDEFGRIAISRKRHF